MKILAIESSCDETAASVIEIERSRNKFGTTDIHPVVLSNIINSQIDIHKTFGGVFPEIASRTHTENIINVIAESLKPKAQSSDDNDSNQPEAVSRELLANIDVIAVTTGPGLMGSLLVGVNFAKTLAYVTNKPIIGINHWLGHIYSTFSGEAQSEKLKAKSNTKIPNSQTKTSNLKPNTLPSFPLLALIVSGGHTGLVLMKSHTEYETIGETLDDAAGEAFDKVAKILGLDYPGGPAISAEAEKFKIKNSKLKIDIKFPRPMLKSGDYNFSFSGLKTSVLNKVRELTITHNLEPETFRSQVAYEFQQAVIDTLISKTLSAIQEYHPKSICLCGGVSANKELRLQMSTSIENWKLETGNSVLSFHTPPLPLTGDNAVMIGVASAYQIANGIEPTTYDKINADSNFKL